MVIRGIHAIAERVLSGFLCARGLELTTMWCQSSDPDKLDASRSLSGAEETRTPNFQLAKLALYQLSYRPEGVTV